MTLDVRSLREWLSDLFNRGRLSGGGPLGAPTLDLAETAPDLGSHLDHEVAGGDAMGAGGESLAAPRRRGRHIRE
jgi:hypothetical protein